MNNEIDQFLADQSNYLDEEYDRFKFNGKSWSLSELSKLAELLYQNGERKIEALAVGKDMNHRVDLEISKGREGPEHKEIKQLYCKIMCQNDLFLDAFSVLDSFAAVSSDLQGDCAKSGYSQWQKQKIN